MSNSKHSKEHVEKLIEKYHSRYTQNNYNYFTASINSTRRRYLIGLNNNEGSMLINPKSVKYKDYDIGNKIYYEFPYIKGTSKYNESWARKFVEKNESNRIKFITCGFKPKMIYVKNPIIMKWRDIQCIRVTKC